MPLFEVAVLERPTPKEEDEGKLEKLIVQPTTVIAVDIQAAGYSVVIDLKDRLGVDKIDQTRIQVLIRPFY